MVIVKMFYLTEIGINQAGCSSDTECATSAAVCSSGSCICPMKYYFDNDNCVESKLHRGSYMSADVLLNLLNEFGKRDKMRGLSSTLSLFHNAFNQFNNTRARMLDSIYHMTLRIF